MPELEVRKADVEEFAYALGRNEPVEPPGGGWTKHQLLLLAGAAIHQYVLWEWNTKPSVAAITDEDMDAGKNKEQLEAVDETVKRFAALALEHCKYVAQLATTPEYDLHFDETHRVWIPDKEGGTQRDIQPMGGVKRADWQDQKP